MDITTWTREQRAEHVERALRWARDFSHRLAEPIDRSALEMLATAIFILDDGRRYASRVLETCDEMLRANGHADTDAAQAELHAAIALAITRLDGHLSTGLDVELVPPDLRVAVLTQATAAADAATARMPAELPEEITDLEALAICHRTTLNRLHALKSEYLGRRRSRCTWCLRAAAPGVVVPALLEDEITSHALQCPHSPGAYAVSAVRSLHERARRRDAGELWDEGRTLTQTLAKISTEIDNLATGQPHKRDVGSTVEAVARDAPGEIESAGVTDPASALSALVAHGITDCSRCGGAHAAMPLHEFKRPVQAPEIAGVLWTHWATCPTANEPIMIRVSPDPIVDLSDDVIVGLKAFADAADSIDHIDVDDTFDRAAVRWLESRGWRRVDSLASRLVDCPRRVKR